MIEQFKFIFMESIESVKRLLSYSFISSLTIMICLIFISFIIYLSDVTNNVSNNFKMNESILKVFISNDINIEESLTICENIKDEFRLELVSFEDRKSLFLKIDQNLKSWLKDDISFIPCLCSFSIDIKSTDQIDQLSSSISNKYIDKVDKIVYPRSYLIKFEKILSLVYSLIFLIGLVIFVVSIYNISNIIKLSIEARKDVIEILQLHGANKTFIKLPYIFEGMIHGLIGFILSSIFIFFCFNLFPTTDYNHFLAQSLITSITFETYMLINLIFGTILGFIGSNLATSKFLD